MRHPLLTTILATLAAGCERHETVGCLEVPADATTCPAPADVSKDDLWIPGDCDSRITRVIAETTPTPTDRDTFGDQLACCYEVVAIDPDPTADCIVGRPFADGRTADAPAAEGPGGAWWRAALAEHASVAAFAQLTLQLMGHGAPLDLLADVQAAAADEVEHARLAAAVAAHLGAPVLRPGRLDPRAPVDVTLPDLAAAALREGCFGETLSALVAEEAARRCVDPVARAALTRIAADEARHAALSWRVVAWALATGGDDVRRALLDAAADPVLPGAWAPHEAWADAGCLGPTATREVIRRGLRDVVYPALTALVDVAVA